MPVAAIAIKARLKTRKVLSSPQGDRDRPCPPQDKQVRR